MDGDRFDEKVDSAILPRRDKNDKKVYRVALKVRDLIDTVFDKNMIEFNFPIRQATPVTNIFRKEIQNFNNLLSEV